MSLDINLYVEKIDDSLIPLWIEKMNQLEMKCEIHPEFSFKNHSGFLPFKIKLYDSQHQELVKDDFMTGFEFYIDDFNFEHEIEKRKPKKGLLDKLFRKKTPKLYYAGPEIDDKLKECKKMLSFVWGTADTFELRMALLSSAVLTVITNGVCCYPVDDIWYDNNTIVKNFLNDVMEYENSLKSKELKLHKFDKW